MAQAIVPVINELVSDGNDLLFTCIVHYLGTDLAAPDRSTITVRVLPGDSDTVIQTKWTDAVVAEATRLGYSVARTAVRMPAYMRGR